MYNIKNMILINHFTIYNMNINDIEISSLRYKIDEHGNIHYLEGYSGAPLLPRKKS